MPSADQLCTCPRTNLRARAAESFRGGLRTLTARASGSVGWVSVGWVSVGWDLEGRCARFASSDVHAVGTSASSRQATSAERIHASGTQPTVAL